ncbi:MAG: 2-hydroxychromene-2-carboxylate isomerase [Pseudomonadota bacterium]|nr:2-hydroxychromene-2-carboxylate isomerase [Pseudomonadota bacterium]MEE3101467.1 2-hydroxychromene-2-carboxylate isomerase [Pseudomonadota bacterium]
MKPVEFLFDFGSPNAYFVHRVLPGLAADAGVEVTYVPILLGGVFKATGNVSPVQAFAHIPAKLAYQGREMERFVARHGLTAYRRNPHFPVNTLGVMRGVFAAKRMGVFEPYVEAVYAAMWELGLKMDDPEVVVATLDAAGLDGAGLMALAQDPEVKAELVAATSAAVERGCFGSPTLFVGEEMWFGKEHMAEAVAFAAEG